MRLEVWQDATDLFKFAFETVNRIDRLDFKLKSQILDAAQSVSSNIAEGYCRRTINEYLQYLSVALGSCGELMTQILGLANTGLITGQRFEEFDKLHYSVENKLIALIRSLQLKRRKGDWVEEFEAEKDKTD
jgi:four helix bundle protein